MADLTCHITTFNCGRAPVDIPYFASHLFSDLKTNLPPDLVVLSLQEIAPLGYSFLGGSLLTPFFTRFTTAVRTAAAQHFNNDEEGGGEYVEVVVRNVGMTALAVYARPEVAGRIRWVETAGVGVGDWELGNKGACAARFGIGDDDAEVVVTFVAAHLAPMEWMCERRNRDWKDICRGLVFRREGAGEVVRREGRDGAEAEPLLPATDEDEGGDERSLFSPASHVFFAGDLNYRTLDYAPKPDDYKKWPQPTDTVSNMKDYDDLFTHDQLTRELRAGKTLHHLAEAQIDFPPTYKYSSAASKDAALGVVKHSTSNETQSSPWAKHRVPSWCDRILYLAATPPTVHAYTALPVQPTSDHRPVSLSFSIPLKPLNLSDGAVKPPFPIRKDWEEARAAARRNEFIVGLGAYLALTWEGEALLAGSVLGILGGYLALRAMLGS